MSRKQSKETDRFVARAADGCEYTIIQYTTFIEADSFESSGWIEGMKSLLTDDGQRVNYRGPGQYELLNGTKLTRV
jgi:hypothetical protein